MIYIFVALIAGAVGACLAVFFMADRFTKREQKAENSAVSERLNKEKKEREKKEREDRNAELERQFEQMMNYHGKEQKKA